MVKKSILETLFFWKDLGDTHKSNVVKKKNNTKQLTIGARSHENAPYMRNENESQPHDWIRVTTLVH